MISQRLGYPWITEKHDYPSTESALVSWCFKLNTCPPPGFRWWLLPPTKDDFPNVTIVTIVIDDKLKAKFNKSNFTSLCLWCHPLQSKNIALSRPKGQRKLLPQGCKPQIPDPWWPTLKSHRLTLNLSSTSVNMSLPFGVKPGIPGIRVNIESMKKPVLHPTEEIKKREWKVKFNDNRYRYNVTTLIVGI